MVKKNENNSLKNFSLVVIGIVLVVLDQVTKVLFQNSNYDLGVFLIRGTTNTGISFGMFQNTSIYVATISVFVLVLLYIFRKEFKNYEAFLMLIIAGIIGNLFDRVLLGYVIDFIDLVWWPVFNIADSLIFIGVFGYIIKQIIVSLKKKD